ncbi:MAG TPA: MFS transporter [Candidatus Dormibacteraeota bacterium]|nr:MFS transporter [Candidatus Dormibacteraeota bacterium]
MASTLRSALKPNPATGGLNWAYVLMGVADATILPFIPLYLYQRGLDAPHIGAVLAGAGAVSIAAGLGWAYLADRKVPAERMLVVASAAAAVIALLVAFAGGSIALAVVLVGLWVARSPFALLDPIALGRLLDTARTRYARIRLRMSAGFAVSAVVSGAGFQAFGLGLIPFVYSPLVAIFGLWVWRALRPTVRAPRAPDKAGGLRALRLPKVPLPLMGFLLSAFLLGAALAATGNFLTLQINVLGGGALLIGAAAAFQALTEIPTMGYMHRLTRYLSHKVLFAIGCAIYIVVFLAWAFVSDPLTAALLKLVVGVAFALTYVAAVVITDELSPANRRATGQALIKSVLFGLAPILGTFGGGLVYGALGPRTMFLAATALAGAAGVIAMIVVPAQRHRGSLSGAEIPAPSSELSPALATTTGKA